MYTCNLYTCKKKGKIIYASTWLILYHINAIESSRCKFCSTEIGIRYKASVSKDNNKQCMLVLDDSL